MAVFKRKIYERLLQWKQISQGSSAVLVQGARRIGKSTIVEEFAKNEYKSFLLIDFSSASQEVISLFEDISDLDYIFFRLQFIYSVNLYTRQSVIIFDEVQKQPLARQAIKHLVKDGRYDYIETGSLVSIQSNSTDILIPSEELKLDMYPMDYEEFRWALGDEVTIPLLKQAYDRKMPLGDVAHRKAMRDFRLYMLVGGMPQAVENYLLTNNLSDVDRVKRNILSLYCEDFLKIDNSGKAKALFSSIPGQLNNNSSRYIVSQAIKGERVGRLTEIIKAMDDSKTTNIAFHSNDPNIGLALTKDLEHFKMYISDTGLFITLAFIDHEVTDNLIYQKLLSDKLSTNLGYVYENIIAQILRSTGKDLYYSTIQSKDKKRYYEIDFIISDGAKISPIEVKSSSYNAHTSLDVFCEKYSSRIKNKYLIYTKDLKVESGITFLPVYMTLFI